MAPSLYFHHDIYLAGQFRSENHVPTGTNDEHPIEHDGLKSAAPILESDR